MKETLEFNSFFNEGEIEKINKDLDRFHKSRFLKRIYEHIISFNRIQQNLKIVSKRYYLIPLILKNYFNVIFLGKSAFRLVEIAVGYECNNKCEQCSCALTYDKSRKRLSPEKFKVIIDEAIEMGAMQFNITGGEPLLHLDETLELIKYIKNNNRYVHLCTNGLLLDRSKMIQLESLGLDSLEMGLDSASKEQHDKNRAKGSYDKIMEAIEIAHELKIPVILNTVITHAKIKSFDMIALVKLAKQKGARLQITPPCITGKWKNNPSILLDKSEREYLRWLLHYPNVRMDTYSSFSGIRCSAAREKLAITPYGDILPCSLIQIPYGNIKDRKLKEAQMDMMKNPFYQSVSKEGCLPSFNREFIDNYILKISADEENKNGNF